MRVFDDILVMPTQGLRYAVGGGKGQGLGGFFRGGPVWPRYALQVRARHLHGLLPIPVDRRPVVTAAAARAAAHRADGVWCGPVSPHYGHMIRDFLARIARSVAETDPSVPLVFSLGPDVDQAPQPFFAAILDHLGAGERTVLLVREPTRFARLRVFPQEERVGHAPGARYLDLLDGLARRRGVRPGSIDRLYVSRARAYDGKLAGEGYLDAVLARSGVTVIHPETMPLGAQLDHYLAARTIIFSEGSALHTLQLLGRLDARVVVLVRRRGRCLAERALRVRARSVAYWNCIAGLIYGCHVHGRPLADRAMVLLDTPALTARLSGIGIDIARHWDEAAYQAERQADLVRFASYMKSTGIHPANLPMIQACMDANGIALDLGAILGRAPLGATVRGDDEPEALSDSFA